eukprot:6187587-Pleurochrysis_carterae.AAC.1
MPIPRGAATFPKPLTSRMLVRVHARLDRRGHQDIHAESARRQRARPREARARSCTETSALLHRNQCEL